MRRLDSLEDQMRGVVTYELAEGRRVCLDARMVRELGAVEAMRACGVDLSAELPRGRQKVIQNGIVIGTVPPDFDPEFVKPGLMYDPRPGDFTLTAEGWIASSSLGGGDMEYLPGFRPA